MATAVETTTEFFERDRREWERMGEELPALIRDLGMEKEDLMTLVDMNQDPAESAIYLFYETADVRQGDWHPHFTWDAFRGLHPGNRGLGVDYDDREPEEAAKLDELWNRVVPRTEKEDQAIETLNRILKVPEGFPGQRGEWAVLLAAVHTLRPRVDRSNATYLDMNTPDASERVWDLVKKTNKSKHDPQSYVDIALGRLITNNVGSEYWKTNFDDPRYDTIIRQALLTYPEGRDFHEHLGKSVRTAVYREHYWDRPWSRRPSTL